MPIHVTSLLCRISETPAALHAPIPGWRMSQIVLIKCCCVSYCDDSRRTNWNVSQLPPCTDSLTSDCSAHQTPSIYHPPIHKQRTSMHTLSWHQPKFVAWGNWQCCVQSKHCMCIAALPIANTLCITAYAGHKIYMVCSIVLTACHLHIQWLYRMQTFRAQVSHHCHCLGKPAYNVQATK